MAQGGAFQEVGRTGLRLNWVLPCSPAFRKLGTTQETRSRILALFCDSLKHRASAYGTNDVFFLRSAYLWFRLDSSNQPGQGGSVHEFDIVIPPEIDGVTGVAARAYDDSLGCAFRRYHAEEFPYDGYAHLA